MNRATIVRGIQLIVAITLATFAYKIYRGIESKQVDLAAGLAHVKAGWLVLAAALALQEGVCGGLRMFVLGRVLCKELRVRTAIISEFVLMFSAGVTPGQAGAAPAQVAVLAHGGMRLVDVATAELLTGACTIIFFLGSGLAIYVLRATGHLVLEAGGTLIDSLLGLSVLVFGSVLLALILCAAYPPLLKSIIRVLAIPCGAIKVGALGLLGRVGRLRPWAVRSAGSPGAVRARLLRSVDELHDGFRVYLRRGKRAYAVAQLLTFGFFCSRFAVAYFILLGLGIPVQPRSFVTIGPPIVQVVLIQALLNFALYLSPTPGASGVAEASSSSLMEPWVNGAYELPYLVLWRILALFLCMFVGGIYVFRYLGTDVLEQRVKDADAESAKRRADEEGGPSDRAA
jgi:glycosyltransferase 2 family protein